MAKQDRKHSQGSVRRYWHFFMFVNCLIYLFQNFPAVFQMGSKKGLMTMSFGGYLKFIFE